MRQAETSKSTGFVIGLVVAIFIIWGSYEVSNQYYFNPATEESLKMSEKLTTLKRTNDESEKIKANATELEVALFNAEKQFNSLKSLVPHEAELPKVLDWVASKAYERALKLEHFSQGAQIKQQGAMSEIPIQVEVMGYPDNVSRFIEDFARFERVLRVRGVHMIQDKPAQIAQPTITQTPGTQPAATQPAQQFQTVRATISFSAYVSKEKLTNKK